MACLPLIWRVSPGGSSQVIWPGMHLTLWPFRGNQACPGGLFFPAPSPSTWKRPNFVCHGSCSSKSRGLVCEGEENICFSCHSGPVVCLMTCSADSVTIVCPPPVRKHMELCCSGVCKISSTLEFEIPSSVEIPKFYLSNSFLWKQCRKEQRVFVVSGVCVGTNKTVLSGEHRMASVLRRSLGLLCSWQPGKLGMTFSTVRKRGWETLGSALSLHLLGTNGVGYLWDTVTELTLRYSILLTSFPAFTSLNLFFILL